MNSSNHIKNENRKELAMQSWREVNEEIKTKNKRIQPHPIEWVFIGVMLALCGFLFIGIIEGMQWLLS